MPGFTVDFSSDLRGSLTRLAMGIAFQYPGADFSLLGAPPFFIGGVLHKTRLEVDEEGTVAAWTPHAEAENGWQPAGIAVASLPWPVHPMDWWRI
jgi:serine protease inhibitor